MWPACACVRATQPTPSLSLIARGFDRRRHLVVNGKILGDGESVVSKTSSKPPADCRRRTIHGLQSQPHRTTKRRSTDYLLSRLPRQLPIAAAAAGAGGSSSSNSSSSSGVCNRIRRFAIVSSIAVFVAHLRAAGGAPLRSSVDARSFPRRCSSTVRVNTRSAETRSTDDDGR